MIKGVVESGALVSASQVQVRAADPADPADPPDPAARLP